MFTVLDTLNSQHVLHLHQPELGLDLTHQLPAVLPGEALDGEERAGAGEAGGLTGDGVPGVWLEESGAS